MLSTIKQFFETHLAPGADPQERDPEHAVSLACAALLIEVAESDFKRSPAERDALLASVHRLFGIDQREARELIELAEQEHVNSTDYFQFTRLINRTYTPRQKVRLVEALWRIALADDELHSHEEHVIRRLADLLHVSHKDFIAAKHRVMGSR